MTQYYSNQDWYNQNQQPASWGAGGYNQQQTDSYSASKYQQNYSTDHSGQMFIPSSYSQDVGDDFEGELPLLQELGINFSHIKAKTFAVLNPFRSVSSDVIADQDLAGPLVFCLLFGSSLLLQGKMQFGYIYGIGALGCIGIYVLLNLMAAEKAISFTCTTSILGYCLLPMAILSLLVAFLNFEGKLRYFISGAAILWCCTSSSKLFITILAMDSQRLLVAYPCALLYCIFSLLAIF